MPKKKKQSAKKSYNLYYKGKRIPVIFYGRIKLAAKNKGVKVNTKKRLHDFFEENKEAFIKILNEGEKSFQHGIDGMSKELRKADNVGKSFYVEQGEKTKLLSYKEIMLKLSLLENTLNSLFDTTGMTIGYKTTYDGSIIFSLPTEEELEEMNEMDVEELIPYLKDTFNIIIYTSDPKSDANNLKKKQIQERKIYYQTTIQQRIYEQQRTGKKQSVKRKKKGNKKG